MQVPIRLADGVVVECSRRDDHLAAATSGVGLRWATLAAEWGGKAACRGKIKTGDMFGAAKPAKGPSFDDRIW